MQTYVYTQTNGNDPHNPLQMISLSFVINQRICHTHGSYSFRNQITQFLYGVFYFTCSEKEQFFLFVSIVIINYCPFLLMHIDSLKKFV